MRNPSLLRSNWVLKSIRTLPWPTGSFELPAWQAHRGYWKSGAPQNTLESLIDARKRKAKMAEFDVRVTKDGVVVLFHDAEFTDGEEQTQYIHELSFNQLKSYRQVTTLKEVLLSPEVPEFLNIEIKSETVLNDPLERKITELIKNLETEKSRVFQNRIMFSSFNPVSIFKMAQYLPEVPRGYLAAEDMDETYLREMWPALLGNFHILHLDQAMITKERMELWNKNRVPVAAWTVNKPEKMRELRSWGVASIISDEIPPKEIFTT